MASLIQASKQNCCFILTNLDTIQVRLKWLNSNDDIDMDTLSEGDTAALRESLAQLSNASR